MDLNELPKPRVLVWIPDEFLRQKVSWLDEIAPTVKIIENLSEVDLGEWDLIVTNQSCAHSRVGSGGYTYQQLIPPKLNILYLVSENQPYSMQTVDIAIDHSKNQHRPVSVLNLQSEIPGNSVVVGSGADGAFEQVVKRDLSATVRGLKTQQGVTVNKNAFNNSTTLGGLEPIAIGPQGVAYAGVFRRSEDAHTVVIPDYVPNLKTWGELSLDLFRRESPLNFESEGEWEQSQEWMAHEELEIHEVIQGEELAFTSVKDAHDERKAKLHAELELVSATAGDKLRQLVSGTGDSLQSAVLEALNELGFEVQDMDLVWPVGARREDYRIQDNDAPDWYCIADATSSRKGFQTKKLLAVGGFVNKYLLEEKPNSLPSRWVIANQHFLQNPNLRPENLVRGEDIELVRNDQTLVIDSVGLFELVNFVRKHPKKKAAARKYLRDSEVELTFRNVRSWIETQI